MAVYVWGLGKQGQLCNGKADNQLVPCRVLKCTGGRKLAPVVAVSCGAHFTAVLCDDRSLYTSGCGKYGRLGGGSEEDCTSLTPVVNVSNVNKVSCGSWHAACVTEDGEVFVWGYGKAVGRDTESGDKPSQNVVVPKPLSFQQDLKIAGVSCGHNYTFVWTSEGQTLSWGKGQQGVLGQGSDKDVAAPKLVDHLKEVRVVHIGAGHSHCGIVSSQGDLYMTGSGSYGALGLGSHHSQCSTVPAKVPSVRDVKEVSCSKGEHHHHTLALTKDGNVLSWGDGYKGKLGLGHQESRDTPTLIPAESFNNETVVRVAAGGIHSAASTQEGSVFTWGCGSDGRLGHPEAEGHRYLFRSDTPRKVESLTTDAKTSPALVSCSYYHTATVLLHG